VGTITFDGNPDSPEPVSHDTGIHRMATLRTRLNLATPTPKPAELRWKYLSVRPGDELKGWVAGQLLPITVHWAEASKPCHRAVTSGALSCKHCEAGMKTRVIGYVPLIDHHGRKVVICASETVSVDLRLVAYKTEVRFSRGKGSRDPLQFRVLVGHECSKIVPQSLERQKGGFDIQPWLLKLWQDEELKSWFERSEG
jgi:hypothetical protein